VALLSGPAGLASYLRRRQLGARLAGPSLPLDIGFSDNVPAAIRNAVKLRDKHCRWAGGCDQPASACDVHHVKHKARGGKTSLDQCILLCHFHHQVMIHRLGWTLVLHRPEHVFHGHHRDDLRIPRQAGSRRDQLVRESALVIVERAYRQAVAVPRGQERPAAPLLAKGEAGLLPTPSPLGVSAPAGPCVSRVPCVL
jgi:hypothetical protein